MASPTNPEEDDPIPPDIASESERESLYAILNLPRSATTAQIDETFRHFSRIYHPDKHLDRVKEAEKAYSQITYAHTGRQKAIHHVRSGYQITKSS
jgi:preprotein translocase subunit Sec63